MTYQQTVQYKTFLEAMSQKILSETYTDEDVRNLLQTAETMLMELDVKTTTNEAMFQHMFHRKTNRDGREF